MLSLPAVLPDRVDSYYAGLHHVDNFGLHFTLVVIATAKGTVLMTDSIVMLDVTSY